MSVVVVGNQRLITLEEIRSGDVRAMSQYHIEKMVTALINKMYDDKLTPIGPLRLEIRIDARQQEA